jgi:integrase
VKDYEDIRGFWGTIRIRRGLKRKARNRDLRITREMAHVLRRLLLLSQCEHVFTSLEDRTQPLSRNTLGDQHRRMMDTGEFDPAAGLHALRHTFLTEAGCYTQNVKALQKLAGHSRIETTMRYIHPDQGDVDAIANQVQQARRERKETQTAPEVPRAPGVPTISPTVN